jgi:hypothetical protein
MNHLPRTSPIGRVAPSPDDDVNPRRGCPRSLAVKCMEILYSLSPDILYTCCQPVKRRRALLESNLAEE